MSRPCDRHRERLPEVAAGAVEPDADLTAHLDECADCRGELDDLVAIARAPASEDVGTVPASEVPRLVREDLAAIEKTRRLAPLLAAIAVVVGVSVAAGIPKRPDFSDLPALFLYGSAALLVLFGAAGLWLSARLSALPRGAAFAFVTGAAILWVVSSFGMPSTGSAPHVASASGILGHLAPCFLVASILALGLVGVTSIVALRARFFPASAGIAVGVGAGLLATPAVVCFCSACSPIHTLVSHGGAVVFAALLSLALYRGLERRRLRARP